MGKASSCIWAFGQRGKKAGCVRFAREWDTRWTDKRVKASKVARIYEIP